MDRGRGQLISHLDEQLIFLESSCQGFDKGNDSEALRIASVLRTLFHDTPKSHSLLVQLGYEGELFLDSCAPFEPVKIEQDGKKMFAVSGFPGPMSMSPTRQGWRYSPLLKQQPLSPGFVPFATWWSANVLRDGDKHYYTRHELALVLTNKEGGAHIDPKLNAQYELMKSGSLGMTANVDSVEGFINSPTLTTMRQLGWEVTESFKAITSRQHNA